MIATRLVSALRRFRSPQGSVSVLVAAALVPLVGMLGAGLDYSRATVSRGRLDAALDAAVLAAAQAAKAADAQNQNKEQIEAAAKKAGEAAFVANDAVVGNVVVQISPALTNRTVTITGTYTADVRTTVTQLIGYPTLPISGRSTASAELSPYIDIYLLIDVSASMALGATTADINKLTAAFGCAFACHNDVKVKGTQYDSFQWAQKNGIRLRMNEINDGIADFVATLQKQGAAKQRLRIAVYSFSTSLTKLVGLTSTLSAATGNLPTAPDLSHEGGDPKVLDYAGATQFGKIMPDFAKEVGVGGDGQTTAKKLVIIATDGVQDPTRSWTNHVELRSQVTPFSPADCQKLDASVSVGVLYAPYLQMPWDWGYVATLGQPSQIGNRGTRFDDIVPQLKACASPGMFVDLGTTSSVASGFKSLFDTFAQVRLTR
ncbi:pilus assembly protein TadG-related protein [uncultured Methylobacterium sp.]|uniref:pilus assembly protein TadG-related protein n=1 Tax=uncultured Methylobacterium sp. TaxID=157278 RepID=UPI002606D968|nr:pilus assembly protein TadG-related protein [uncultured Methylobacterium sp.]